MSPRHVDDTTPAVPDEQLSSIDRLTLLIEAAEARKNGSSHAARIPTSLPDTPFPVPSSAYVALSAEQVAERERAAVAQAATLDATPVAANGSEGLDQTEEAAADRLAAIAAHGNLADVLAGRVVHDPTDFNFTASTGEVGALTRTEDVDAVVEGLPIFAALLNPPADAEPVEYSPTATGPTPEPGRTVAARPAPAKTAPARPTLARTAAGKTVPAKRELPRITLLVAACSFFATLSLGIAARPNAPETILIVALGVFVSLLPMLAAPLLTGRAPAVRAAACSLLVVGAVLAPLVTWNLNVQARDRAAAETAAQLSETDESARETATARKAARDAAKRFATLNDAAMAPTRPLMAITAETDLADVGLPAVAAQQVAFEDAVRDFAAWAESGQAEQALASDVAPGSLSGFVSSLDEWARLQRKVLNELAACNALAPSAGPGSAGECIGSSEQVLALHQRWARTVETARRKAEKLA